MSMLLVKYETVGRPVYDDELGPNTGYDGCRSGFTFVRDEESVAEMAADMETYRKVEIVAELSDADVEHLRRQLQPSAA